MYSITNHISNSLISFLIHNTCWNLWLYSSKFIIHIGYVVFIFILSFPISLKIIYKYFLKGSTFIAILLTMYSGVNDLLISGPASKHFFRKLLYSKRSFWNFWSLSKTDYTKLNFRLSIIIFGPLNFSE